VKNPTILVTTTKICLIHTLTPAEQVSAKNFASLCSLKWKLGKLFISHHPQKNIPLAALENFHWSINCLNRSCAEIVCVDLDLGASALQIWANVCQKSKKSIFIRVPSVSRLPQKLYPLSWALKRVIDCFTATLFIVLLSPIILTLSLLIRLTFSGPIFSRQWSIGQRGRLFQVIKFRITLKDRAAQYYPIMESQQDSQKTLDTSQMTRLGYWMRRYRLDSLPTLVNVLRGEMSIVGPRPLDLSEAIQINLKYRSCLRGLPGMTDIFPSKKFSRSLDTNSKSHLKLAYLCNWSLLRDMKILLKTILRNQSA
jgi:lipopolysaccharide/colanic/teichoic acid biosynthesis glycosyltransferase